MQFHLLLAACVATFFTSTTYGQEQCTLQNFMDVGLDCATQMIESNSIDLNEIGTKIKIDIYQILKSVNINVANPLRPTEECMTNCSTQNGCDCDVFIAYNSTFVSDLGNYDFLKVISEQFNSGTLSAKVIMDIIAKYEPMIAYMVGSIYKKFLKNSDKQIIIPGTAEAGIDIDVWLGDLTGMETVYLDGMSSYCSKVGPTLATCLETGIAVQCGTTSKNAWSQYLSLFGSRYCSGTSVRNDVKTTLMNNIDSLFREVECILAANDTVFELDMEHLENIGSSFESVGYQLESCNLDLKFERVFIPIEIWVGEVVIPILNTSDVLSLNLNPLLSILDNGGPIDEVLTALELIMQCLIPPIENLQDVICPDGVDPFNMRTKFRQILTLLSTALPLDQLQTVKNWDIWGKPRQINVPSRARETVLMINGMILGTDGMPLKTCKLDVTEDREIIFAAGSLKIVVESQESSGIRSLTNVITKIGETQSDMIFSDTDGQVESQSQIYPVSLTRGDGYVPFQKSAYSECVGIYDSVYNSETFSTNNSGTEMCNITDPITGSLIGINTITSEGVFDIAIVLRTSSSILSRADGQLVGDCETDADYDTFTSTSRIGCNFCTKYVQALQKPCQYWCDKTYSPDWLENLIDETLQTVTRLDDDVRDRELWYSSINYNGSSSYHPCSLQGWLANAASICAYTVDPSRYYNTFGNITNGQPLEVGDFVTFIKELGDIEPYVMFAVASFVHKYGQFDVSAFNFGAVNTYSMADAVTTALDNHCVHYTPVSKCISDQIDVLACYPGVDDTVSALRERYCENLDTTPTVKQSVITMMTADFDTFSDVAACIVVSDANTGTFTFNEELLAQIYDEGVRKCAMDELYDDLRTLISRTENVDISVVLLGIKPQVASRLGCIYNILERTCSAQTTFQADVTRLIPHLNFLTANLLDFQISDFIRPRPNPASDKRATMWVVGDPHVRRVQATEFATCEANGFTTFFSNDFLRFTGYNELACDGCEASYLKNLTIEFYNASDPTDTTAKATYTTECSNISQTFSDGESVDIVTAIRSVAIEYRPDPPTVIITDGNSGIMFGFRTWTYICNVVVRCSETLAMDSIGLLVSGCDLSSTIIDKRRRKRATDAECVTACSNSPELMRGQCEYDCVVLDNTEVGTGSYNTINKVEEDVVSKDAHVKDAIPKDFVQDEPLSGDTIPSGGANDIRASILITSVLLAALALLLRLSV